MRALLFLIDVGGRAAAAAQRLGVPKRIVEGAVTLLSVLVTTALQLRHRVGP